MHRDCLTYIMEMGGRKTDRTMKSVYRSTLADRAKTERDKMTQHFNGMFAQDPSKNPAACCNTCCIDHQKQQKTPDPITEVQALKTRKNRVNTDFFTPSASTRIHKKNGDDGIRTRDLSVANAALSQLSYVPI